MRRRRTQETQKYCSGSIVCTHWKHQMMHSDQSRLLKRFLVYPQHKESSPTSPVCWHPWQNILFAVWTVLLMYSQINWDIIWVSFFFFFFNLEPLCSNYASAIAVCKWCIWRKILKTGFYRCQMFRFRFRWKRSQARRANIFLLKSRKLHKTLGAKSILTAVLLYYMIIYMNRNIWILINEFTKI